MPKPNSCYECRKDNKSRKPSKFLIHDKLNGLANSKVNKRHIKATYIHGYCEHILSIGTVKRGYPGGVIRISSRRDTCTSMADRIKKTHRT